MEKILLVYGEGEAVETFLPQLKKHFTVELSRGAEQALNLLEHRGPYAVIAVTGLIGKMDGYEFLTRAWSISPDSVRLIFVKPEGQKEAVKALNEDIIFRFILIPFTNEDLQWNFQAAVAQYHLDTTKRDLLEKTLIGSVSILNEVLSLVNPMAFSRAERLRKYVLHMANRLSLSTRWEFELAALLSQIGCVTLTPEILNKLFAGQEMSAEEQAMFSSHPAVGYSLLSKIPRLGGIARMIRDQQKPLSEWKISDGSFRDNRIFTGAHLIQIAFDFDQMIIQGKTRSEALIDLLKRKDEYFPEFTNALKGIASPGKNTITKSVDIISLNEFMILDQNVMTNNGLLLATKGQDVSVSVIERLRNFSATIGVEEPIRVLITRVPLNIKTKKGG